jgi:hypothetical protein
MSWRGKGDREKKLTEMRRLSVFCNLMPYTDLFSTRERHIFAAGALWLQMAAITRQSCRSTVMNCSISCVGNKEIQPVSSVSYVYQ